MGRPSHGVMSGRRILFAAHPTVGHTNALVTIARRMAPPPLPARLPVPEVLKVGGGLAASIEARGVPVARLRPPPLVMFHAMLLPWLRGYTELRRARQRTGPEPPQQRCARWRAGVREWIGGSSRRAFAWSTPPAFASMP